MLDISTANIYNVNIAERGDKKQGYHKLSIDFDYEITNFHKGDGLYRCSVQFMEKQARHSAASTGERCIISSPSGHKSLFVSTPIDKGLLDFDHENQARLQSFQVPIKYSIMIVQRIRQDPVMFKGIGTTDMFVLDP